MMSKLNTDDLGVNVSCMYIIYAVVYSSHVTSLVT